MKLSKILPFIPVVGFIAMMKDGELEKIGTPLIFLSSFVQTPFICVFIFIFLSLLQDFPF